MPYKTVYMDSDCEDEEFGAAIFGKPRKGGKKKGKGGKKGGHNSSQASILNLLHKLLDSGGGHAHHQGGPAKGNQKPYKYIICKESFQTMKETIKNVSKEEAWEGNIPITLNQPTKKNKRRVLNVTDIQHAMQSILKGYKPVKVIKQPLTEGHHWATYECIYHTTNPKGYERHFNIHITPDDKEHWHGYDHEKKKESREANDGISRGSSGKWHVHIKIGHKHAQPVKGSADAAIPTEGAPAAAAADATTTAPRGIASGIINLI